MSFRHMLAMASGQDAPKQLEKASKQQSPASRPAAVPSPTPKPSRGSSPEGPTPSPKPKVAPALAPRISRPPQTGKKLPIPKENTAKRPPSDLKAPAPAPKRQNTSSGPKPAAARTPSPATGGFKTKISFKDMMKKAESVDTDKFKVQMKAKERKPEVVKQTKTAAILAARSRSASQESGVTSPKSSRRTLPSGSKSKQATASPPRFSKSLAPAPIAGPSQKLAERLNRRSSRADDYENDLSDFIDDEEDERDAEPSYRDEIWKMFNRGRSRRDYVDEDSDADMEATGADILAEEMRSARQARREDQEEEARLQKLAADKARRKAQRGH